MTEESPRTGRKGAEMIWVIAEVDRSITTLLLSSDY